MSHSSGIRVSPDLLEEFQLNQFHLLFISISEDEELVCKQSINDSSAAGFASIQQWIQSTEERKQNPCFIIYRLNEEQQNQFLLLSYIPDSAAVRLKMLYSSTKATLAKQLGDSKFPQQYHANSFDELSEESYLKHIKDQNIVDKSHLMTQRERDMKQAQLMHGQDGHHSVSSKQTFNTGIKMKIANSEVINEFRSGSGGSQLIFSIDTETETITVASFNDLDEALKAISRESPRFALLSIKSDTESTAAKTLFLYTCPAGAKVKERMLYSATRQFMITTITSEFSIAVDAKSELSDLQELSLDWLKTETFPVTLSNTDSSAADSVSRSGFIKKTVAKPGRRAKQQ